MKQIYQMKRTMLIAHRDDCSIRFIANGKVYCALIAEFEGDASIEDMWDMCNNSCWWNREDYMKMTNYKDKGTCKFYPSYKGYCNSDIFVVDDNGSVHVADSCGWTVVSDMYEAMEHFKTNSEYGFLRTVEKKYSGYEYTLSELKEIAKDRGLREGEYQLELIDVLEKGFVDKIIKL